MADAAYLVTWNPASKPWPELDNLVEQTVRGLLADEWWNVANQGIAPGDRVFLLKQGAAPTGIMGAGRARTDSTRTRPHWDNPRASRGDTVNYIDIDWEVILNPGRESLLPEAQIQADGLPQRLWNARNSGNSIVPAPKPIFWSCIAGGVPNSAASVTAIAAPVGVTSSRSIPLL